jgi:hypothetical protein
LIETEVSYVKLDPKHANEKPYTVNYDTAGTFPKTNVTNEPRKISIQDFRPFLDSRSFAEYGFSAVRLTSSLTSNDFNDAQKVTDTFYPEVQEMLSRLFPDAAKIEILEHQVRIHRKLRVYC